MAKKTSKSWYVKIKGADGNEREERVTGITTPEEAMALVVAAEGEEIVSARPVRKYKNTNATEAQ